MLPKKEWVQPNVLEHFQNTSSKNRMCQTNAAFGSLFSETAWYKYILIWLLQFDNYLGKNIFSVIIYLVRFGRDWPRAVGYPRHKTSLDRYPAIERVRLSIPSTSEKYFDHA